MSQEGNVYLWILITLLCDKPYTKKEIMDHFKISEMIFHYANLSAVWQFKAAEKEKKVVFDRKQNVYKAVERNDNRYREVSLKILDDKIKIIEERKKRDLGD